VQRLTDKTPEELFNTGGGADFYSEASASDTKDMQGRILGDYRIKALIGEGGMGRVYRAERTDGKFERDVAIKISHASRFNSDLRSRFLQEQHILASMNHVNVASLFDAGTTEQGWPYIIMELVEGSEIDDYVDSRGLTHEQITRLILPVLEALAFAHSRLIVHRDIKPSNIVITNTDEPRLLDFGIAKLLENDASLLTEARPMTISSASPEQILGQPITVASDIYQVGLLLHRLLLGRSALPEQCLADAISRAVEAKPFYLGAESRAELPRDLGLIVLRCLQVDPAQRYRDVNTLRDDLISFLENRPVSVSAPTMSYRLKKLVQRNRLVSFVSVLLLLTVAGGTTLYTVQITKAREAAENQATISQEVIDFLIEVFNVSDPGENRGNTVTARELLEKGATDLESDFHDRPLIRAKLQIVIAGVFRKLGLYKDALPLYESSHKLRMQELGANHGDTLIAGRDLGIIYELQDRFDDAEKIYLSVLEQQRKVLGSDDIETMKSLQNLGSLYYKLARYEEAANYWEEALNRRRRVLGIDHPDYATTLSNVPIAYIGLGQLDRAQELFLEGLEVKRRIFGHDHPTTIGALGNVGQMYVDRAMYDRARPYLEETWELSRRIQGESHPTTLISGTNLASFYIRREAFIADLNPLTSAQQILDGIIPVARQDLGDDHQITIGAITEFANLENTQKNHQTALNSFNEILGVQIQKFGASNRSVLATRANIAKTYALLNQYEDAASEFEEIVEIQNREIGKTHPDRLTNLLELADVHLALEDAEEAESLCREAIAGFLETLGRDDPQTLRATEHLAKVLAEVDK